MATHQSARCEPPGPDQSEGAPPPISLDLANDFGTFSRPLAKEKGVAELPLLEDATDTASESCYSLNAEVMPYHIRRKAVGGGRNNARPPSPAGCPTDTPRKQTDSLFRRLKLEEMELRNRHANPFPPSSRFNDVDCPMTRHSNPFEETPHLEDPNVSDFEDDSDSGLTEDEAEAVNTPISTDTNTDTTTARTRGTKEQERSTTVIPPREFDFKRQQLPDGFNLQQQRERKIREVYTLRDQHTGNQFNQELCRQFRNAEVAFNNKTRLRTEHPHPNDALRRVQGERWTADLLKDAQEKFPDHDIKSRSKIGRASCRERV